MDQENTNDCGCVEKYFEKVFEPPSKTIFPVGVGWDDEREAFGAVIYDAFGELRLDTKSGKMFLKMACQVLLRRRQLNR